MSEIRNEVTKMNIRGELNLIFSMSKLIVTILDVAPDNTIACNTLRSTAEGILNQAAYLYSKVSEYTEDLYESQ